MEKLLNEENDWDYETSAERKEALKQLHQYWRGGQGLVSDEK